jgi:hypothetical protein
LKGEVVRQGIEKGQLDSASLKKLAVEDRLAYVLDSVIANKSVWGLMGEEGWILVTSDEDTCLPIWPNEHLAMAWSMAESPNAKPKEIDLEDWQNAWLPGMNKNGTSILVCPFEDESESTLLSAEQLILYMDESEIN